ncbi:ABC transporter ATP-binding protein [Archangium gephyra]|uniref:ABC transporter ATP-binding protein n=1 Tax=Archangium gephyra TaxID=48 RepID=UPI0035D4B954
MNTNDQGVLAARYEEVKALIQSNDLARGTKRLLDLAKEFEPRRDLLNEAILLTAEYGRLAEDERRFGRADSTEHARNRLLFRMFGLADVLRDEALKRLHADGASRPEAPDSGRTSRPAPGQTALENARQEFLLRRRIAQSGAEQDSQLPPPILQCIDLGKTYRSRAFTFSLAGVSIAARAGEITGVVGTNGSGKTTLLQILAGTLLADEGELLYPALEPASFEWLELRDRIAYVQQQPPPWHGTVVEQLMLHASLRGINGEANEDEVEFILHRLGLEKYRNVRRNQLSGGFQMRFELAKALVSSPWLLVLDEPLAPLDTNSQQIFLQDLRDLANSMSNPLAVIVSSQHLFEIESVADQILVLDNGRLRFCGHVGELGNSRSMNSYELGCSAPLELIQRTLSCFQAIRVESSGRNLLIHTPLNISSTAILRALLAEPLLEVRYFRNISNSSRRLLAAEPHS